MRLLQVLGTFSLLAAASTQGAEDFPGFLADKSDFIGEHFFPVIRHEPNKWISIETSDDLKAWTGLVNVRSNREVFVFGDEKASSIEQRYYRLRSGAPTVGEARARWLSKRPEQYRFHMRRQIIYKSDILSATVTVDGVSKTVSDIEVDRPDDSLETSVGPDDFPDIDELFDLLAETETLNTLQTWIRYDNESGLPVECQLDFRSVRENFDHFLITDFQALPSE